jgi:hypothetical protein
MFESIEIVINWGFLFGLTSVLALITGWLGHKLKGESKNLTVKDVTLQPLLNKPNGLENEIKIHLNDIEIESLNKIQVFIMNDGNQTLNNFDFHIMPTIELKGFANILNVNVTSSHEFTKIKTKIIGESKLVLTTNDFEPKTYIKIEIIFESIENDYNPYFETCLKEKEKINIDLKHTSLTRSTRNTNFAVQSDSGTLLIITMFYFLIILGLTYLIARFGLGVNFENPDGFGIWWKVIFFSPATILSLFFLIKFIIKIDIFHYRWLKIKKWYNIK